MKPPQLNRRRGAVAAAALVAALGCSAVVASDADACGMFVPSLDQLRSTLPRLAVEQVLILHDPDTKTEHFIREIRVDRGAQSFGFVVPVPGKPEVARVEKEPFTALRAELPIDAPRDPNGPPGGASKGGAEGGGGVTVLSEQRIGNFTTFVLAATSGGGLEKWLADNRFGAPPLARGWIEHYVRNAFYFVAFRYDPPKDAPATGITGETVRISFPTPVPYYPYLEPRHEAPSRDERALAVWFASRDAMHPIVGVSHADGTSKIEQYALPPHASYEKSRAKLEKALGPELAKLLPKGELVVNTYQDLRRDRSGRGDVLFVPDTAQKLDEAALKERARFLPLLDPSLEAGPGVRPVSVVEDAR
jgi:hypothetical protein